MVNLKRKLIFGLILLALVVSVAGAQQIAYIHYHESTPSPHTFTMLSKILGEHGYQVKIFDPTKHVDYNSIKDGGLLILGPSVRYGDPSSTSSELSAYKEFVYNGGVLVLTGIVDRWPDSGESFDSRDINNFNHLLKDMGANIQFNRDHPDTIKSTTMFPLEPATYTIPFSSSVSYQKPAEPFIKTPAGIILGAYQTIGKGLVAVVGSHDLFADYSGTKEQEDFVRAIASIVGPTTSVPTTTAPPTTVPPTIIPTSMQIKGVNYYHEGMGYINKNYSETKNDLELIKGANANYIRLQGSSDNVFKIADEAHKIGLKVFLTYRPTEKISYEDYKNQLKIFSKHASEHDVEILAVGNELSIKPMEIPLVSLNPFNVFPLQNFINDLIKIARESYSGPVCYVSGDWERFPLPFFNPISEDKSDIICMNAYPKGKLKEYEKLIKNAKDLALKNGKSLLITEFGALSISEALEAGGRWEYPLKNKVTPDENKQAEIISNAYEILKKQKVEGVFLFCWDEPEHSYGEFTKDEIGYGIYRIKESIPEEKRPKKAYWRIKELFLE